jgi:hypothetical protein
MASQEVFGAAEIGIRGIRVFVARGEEDFGGGNQENLAGALLATRHVR